MKQYVIEVIGLDRPYRKVIECHRVEWSEAGNYVFVIDNKKTGTDIIAMYPVSRTIIESVVSLKSKVK